MTERLYQKDAYMTECTARLVRMDKIEGKDAVVLDRTCFYPTSGGQLHDTGTINDIKISDVVEQGETIFHVLEQSCDFPEEVQCKIDWQRRFDHMQQHTGQHILTQCIIRLIGAETVSSSLGSEISTIDINRTAFNEDEQRRIEEEANNWIYMNVPVHILYPTDEEMAEMPLRKKPPAGKKTRIVHVEGLDYSPCGGTHCAYTGEVGMIKIRHWEKMRGNIRIEFYCGSRALRDYQSKMTLVHTMIGKLSTQETAIPEAIERIQEEHKTQQKTISNLQKKLNEYSALEFYDKGENVGELKLISVELDSGSINDLKMLAQKIRSFGPCFAALGSREVKPAFVITCTEDIKINLNDILNELRKTFTLKGGGSPGMVQGALESRGDLPGFLQQVKKQIKNNLHLSS